MPSLGGCRLASAIYPLLLAVVFLVAITQAASSVLGIDIGTEYLKAALVKPGIPLEIVLTKDSKRKEAAAVAFKPGTSPSLSSDGIFPERAYGGDALALAARFPGDVYSNIKPLLGLGTKSNPLVGLFSQRYPGLQVQPCNERGTVCLKSETFQAGEQPFTVEEILAMELQNIQANAEAFAGKGNIIKDAVITVPAFYTAEEKRAVETAADLAGLNVLAMITDGLAVGLHYSTTRTFPVVNEGGSPEYHLVYDMGAGSTTATVLRFQGRTVKDVGKFNKTIQEVQVVGVGWDKSLGGDALNTAILEDMIVQFADSKPMRALGAGVDEIKANGKTMAKLLKEAERMRQVLSANTETQASFEGLYDGDVNFKYKIKRSKFEEMAVAYEERVKLPVLQALEMAKLDLDAIESIILHGGAVRTPFVQKALESVAGKASTLRTNVNSDEAAAFGAAFKAASLSPSFRVKEIRTSEAAVMPVTVSWVVAGKEKQQKLFIPSSLAGSEKQLPVRFTEDFSFSLSQQVQDGVAGVRNIPISRIQTTNLTASVNELEDKYGCETSAIATQFSLRISPIDGLPEVVRSSVSCEVLDTGNKGGVVDGVKGFFGFGSKKEGQEVLDDNDEESIHSGTTSSSETSTTSSSADNASASKVEERPKALEKKKIVVNVGYSTEAIGLPRVSPSELKRMKDRLKGFDMSDTNRKLREEALNILEGYTYKVRDLVEDEGFISASTEQQRAVIENKSKAASEWLYDDGADAKTEVLTARLEELKDLVEPIQERKEEAAQRPEHIKAVKDAINQTKMILQALKHSAEYASIAAAEASSSSASSSIASDSVSESTSEPSSSTTEAPAFNLDDLDDEPISESLSTASAKVADIPAYSVEDLAPLSAAHEGVVKWLDEKVAAQDKLATWEEPVLKVSELKAKGDELQMVLVEALSKQMAAAGIPGTGGKAAKANTKTTSSKKAKSTSTAKGKGKGKGKKPAKETDGGTSKEAIKDEL